ncbi:fasciclin domain-containing protein [Cuspidothrix issatschenkoi LEGE 03284]|uniref:fasciclin domain-containing protein n=1 Tax=Cuspidothrix issatschenkoi TaxID=230752 RepID=UPI0018829940|nr:fasciclin domain-containing protein [Cuspidothrix issatschenkoi]MBE9233292.1 fasciclin domain-containing protein [Cuspidothrix issatschenkoi LEGE 03284]
MTPHYGKLFIKVLGIMGFASLTLVITLPSPAQQVVNPSPNIFNEPPYNRSPRSNQTLPIPKPKPQQTETPTEKKNLIVLANDNGSFKTLVKALTAAGLIDTLQGEGPFTIFAPTDAAFAKLPQDALQDLLKPENKEVLIKVLTYHVVSGKVLSSDLKSGEVKSLQGDPITVKVNNDVQVNDATVTKADIEGSNGVIHQIDNLILPPSL